LAVALIMTVSGYAAADAMLRIRPQIIVTPGSEVRLSQLVDGQGLSREMLAKLSSISISKAPELGEKQELSNSNITSLLRPLIQEEHERGNTKIHVVVPKTVVIDTTKRELTPELVRMEIMQTWQPLCADCRLEIESLSLPRITDIRDWTLKLQAELPHGSFSIPVDLVRESGAMTAAWISGRLIVKREVPVAKRVMNISEHVNAEDFKWEYRDTSYAVDSAPAADELAGMHMKQGLRAGEVLFRNMLEKERAVRRGDMVQLRSAEGAWEVTISAIAQQDAFIGDVINLKSPKSNNILVGRVTGQGEAELR